jgi:hypothetical protein
LIYRDLPGAVFDIIVPRFGILVTAEHRATLLAATKRHSKRSDVPFSVYSDAPADPAQAATAAFQEPTYRKLERWRLAKSGL